MACWCFNSVSSGILNVVVNRVLFATMVLYWEHSELWNQYLDTTKLTIHYLYTLEEGLLSSVKQSPLAVVNLKAMKVTQGFNFACATLNLE